MKWLAADGPDAKVAHYLADGQKGTLCGASLPLQVTAARMGPVDIKHFGIKVCRKCEAMRKAADRC